MAILPHLIHIAAFAAYLEVSARFWRVLRDGGDGANAQAALRLRAAEWLVLPPLVLHAAGLGADVFFTGDAINFSAPIAASFFLLLTVALCRLFRLAAAKLAPPAAVYVLLLPLAAAGVVAPPLLPAIAPLALSGGVFLFVAHFILAALAYGVSLLAFLQLALARIAEYQLRRGRAAAWLASPLLAEEEACFRALLIGFALLSLTLVTGALRALDAGIAVFALNHKNIFAALTWLVFGGLLLGRRWRGWRGRAAFNWAGAGFVFLLLSYLGTGAVLQLILHR
jgi:ABC-type uncharacterized transport system permease subunit